MTELLERAVALARGLTPRQQDRIARIMIVAAEDADEPYELTPEEEAWLEPRLAAADRGEFATQKEVTATFAKYGVRYEGS